MVTRSQTDRPTDGRNQVDNQPPYGRRMINVCGQWNFSFQCKIRVQSTRTTVGGRTKFSVRINLRFGQSLNGRCGFDDDAWSEGEEQWKTAELHLGRVHPSGGSTEVRGHVPQTPDDFIVLLKQTFQDKLADSSAWAALPMELGGHGPHF